MKFIVLFIADSMKFIVLFIADSDEFIVLFFADSILTGFYYFSKVNFTMDFCVF